MAEDYGDFLVSLLRAKVAEKLEHDLREDQEDPEPVRKLLSDYVTDEDQQTGDSVNDDEFDGKVREAVANTGKSEDEVNRQRVFEELDRLGGKTVGEDSLIFEGTKFILPKSMEGNLPAARKYLKEWEEQQDTEFEFSKSFPYKPYDGAAAFERAMKRAFGTSGIGAATRTMFGSNPPAYVTVASGPGMTMQVPWGRVSFSPLNAVFDLDWNPSPDGIIFTLSVTAPLKHRRRIEAFFNLVQDELKAQSLYKGRAIMNAHTPEPTFLDLSTFDASKMVYSAEVLTQLDVNVWAPLRYTDSFRTSEVPLKRAVLVEGPNGCLTGDTEVIVNRGGNGVRRKLADVVHHFNGTRMAGVRNWREWDPTIPTMIGREMPDGTIRLGRIDRAWFSGRKEVFKVTTDSGRTIRATTIHPFLTERGWVKLGDLKEGDEVHVQGEQKSGKGNQRERGERRQYPLRSVGKHHPYSKGTPASGYHVATHRLVMDAHLNGLELEEFISRVKSGDMEDLTFLDPTRYVVHHKNEDTANFTLENLEVMTQREHAAHHALEGAANVLYKVAIEKVVSVEADGEEDTYDLSVTGEPHNFLANGFVVHNTGKSLSGLRTAELAVEHGWTFILVRPGEDPLEALKTAQQYAPAVVFSEDMDTWASAEGRSRVELSRVLDGLDSASTKGKEVMAVFTTNFPERLDKSVVRAGRLDAVIHVAELDRDAYERLIKAYIPAKLLDSQIDWDAVIGSYTDAEKVPMLPAFAAEAATSAIRVSIARNGGKPALISTGDLIAAAVSKRDHLRLMADAVHGDNKRPELAEAFAGVISSVLKNDVRGGMDPSDSGHSYDIVYEDKPES